MTSFLNPSRRGFLRTTAGAVASLILPRSLFAGKADQSFWFIAESGDSWPVPDPVVWFLENAHQPVLERATVGLLELSPDDGDRIIRLVTRRCKLNLIELHPGSVIIHRWGTQTLVDVRPFFKAHGLAHPNVEVVVKDRKQEVITRQTGDNFRYGDPLAANLPLDLYLSKWQSRFEEQPDDSSAAPATWSGFVRGGVEDNQVPWTALKSTWRRTSPMLCLNCDQPTLLTNFGYPWVGMLNRSPRFVHVCGACYRSYRDESVKDVASWIVANLDAEVRPDFEMVWDRRVKWETA